MDISKAERRACIDLFRCRRRVGNSQQLVRIQPVFRGGLGARKRRVPWLKMFVFKLSRDGFGGDKSEACMVLKVAKNGHLKALSFFQKDV